jgi:thioredoxin 1
MPCRWCGKDVSPSAASCPNCGEPDPWRKESELEEFWETNFEKEVLRATEPVVVHFWANWAVPCQMITTTLVEISSSTNSKTKIVEIDVDSHPRTAAKHSIASVPTLLIYKHGRLLTRQEKFSSAAMLKKWISASI